DLGVMVNADGGATWTTLGSGLPRVVVPSLVLHRPTRTLRAATHGRSMWDYILPPESSALPSITSLSPSTKNAGDAGFTLTIAGKNFSSNSHIMWNGVDRQIGAVTATSLTVQIPASDVRDVGPASIVVFNP